MNSIKFSGRQAIQTSPQLLLESDLLPSGDYKGWLAYCLELCTGSEGQPNLNFKTGSGAALGASAAEYYEAGDYGNSGPMNEPLDTITTQSGASGSPNRILGCVTFTFTLTTADTIQVQAQTQVMSPPGATLAIATLLIESA